MTVLTFDDQLHQAKNFFNFNIDKDRVDTKVKSKKIEKKWTHADIQKHQLKMAEGEIPWEEIWEVPGKFTAEEYYEMMDEDSHWELIENTIVVHSPAGMEHQDIVGSLYTLIRTHVTMTDWGIAYTAPAGLEIDGLPNKFEPDIFAISGKKAVYVKGSFCRKVPEFVVEVALTKKSLNQINDTKKPKFNNYAQIGIKEYLVIYAPEKGDVKYWRYYNQKGKFVKKKKGKLIRLESIGLQFPEWVITDRECWRKSIIHELLASTVVKQIDPKVRVDGVDPKIRVDGVDPEIRVEGVDPEIRVKDVDPEIRVKDVDPEIRVKDVDPEIRVKDVDPEIRVKDVDPEIRVKDVDPKIRVSGLSIEELVAGLSNQEKQKLIEYLTNK